jgi:hypothetical protein
VTGTSDDSRSAPSSEIFPAALVDYAERLLLGTGLDVEQALLIARGDQEAPPQLSALGEALRAGWKLSGGRDPA